MSLPDDISMEVICNLHYLQPPANVQERTARGDLQRNIDKLCHELAGALRAYVMPDVGLK